MSVCPEMQSRPDFVGTVGRRRADPGPVPGFPSFHGFIRGWLLLFLAFALSQSGHAATSPAYEVARSLRFSEIMYQPSGGDPFEFVELQNSGTVPLAVGGYSIDGLKYVFPTNTVLQPGQLHLLINAGNPGAFHTVYPRAKVDGVYSGKLSNGGERLAIRDTLGRSLVVVHFAPTGFWPIEAAGNGFSMEFVGGDGDPDDPANWVPSLARGGTPGELTVPRPLPDVHLSEVQLGSISGVTTLQGSPWVELENTGSTSVSIAGWTLSTNAFGSGAYVFPAGAGLTPGSRLVLRFGAGNGPELRADLVPNPSGGGLYLRDAAGGRVDGLQYGPQAGGVSLVRVGRGWKPGDPSPGEVNRVLDLPSPGALWINEWYADVTGRSADWVEFHYPAPGGAVSLTGLFLTTSNALIRLAGPAVMGPLGFAQWVADDRSAGGHLPFKLQPAGGLLQVSTPAGGTLDLVEYGPQSAGLSEGRLPDGSSTVVRFPEASSPGSSNLADSDRDGMPDYWELRNGLDPHSAADASLDPDGDGLTNLQEFQAGTDPRAPTSVLRVTLVAAAGGGFNLRFDGVAGRTYSVLRREDAAGGPWRKVAEVLGLEDSGPVEIGPLPAEAGRSVYVVATPLQRLAGESALAFQRPSPGETRVASGSEVEIGFRSAVDPMTVRTNTLAVVDDLGRAVRGEFRFSDDFRRVIFHPRVPFDHATRFTVRVTPAVLDGSGKPMVPEGDDWAFSTVPAPELAEDRFVYEQDGVGLLKVALSLHPKAGGYTLADVNSDSDPNDAYKPRVDLWFTDGTYASGRTNDNAMIQQRGQTTRLSPQKSYSVHLYSGEPDWRGHHILHFNKHPYDLTKVRNRLSFDLMKGVRHLTSLRTSFVQLGMDGVPYGLFTQVEDPSPRSWLSHGLDGGPDAQLYKAQFMEFERYPGELMTRDSPGYDEARFNSHVEIKGSKDHQKLLNMLDDLNQGVIPIDRVVAKHFNRDNFMTWLAVNILMDNKDTTSQNFHLYSPADSACFYLTPWDYDGAWGFYNQPSEGGSPWLSRWHSGICNWWSSVLVRRWLQVPGNVVDLESRVAQLAAVELSEARIGTLLDAYKAQVKSVISQEPDLANLPTVATTTEGRFAEWESEYARLRTVVSSNLAGFKQSLSRPMPVFLGVPSHEEGGWRLFWDASYHLQGHPLVYDVTVARTPAMAPADVVFEAKAIQVVTALVPEEKLPSGTYFLRVIVRDSTAPETNWQVAFDSYYDQGSARFYHGTTSFQVP